MQLQNLPAVLLGGLLALAGLAQAFTNPIRNPGGADPQVTYFDGWYYLLSTEWTNLQIARAQSIDGLKTATPKVIYSDSNASRCCNVWAPEIHYFDGIWYLYYTAGQEADLTLQRMHVLVGGANPWDFAWTYGGQLNNDWGIDGTILRFTDWGNYMVYSCQTGVPYQSACLQPLGADRVSLTGSMSVISQPDQPFEESGTPVQEGFAALYFGGRTYLAYSASYCWTPDYCVALLEWDGSSDPALPSAWTKHNGCSLGPTGNGNYGTGHNQFFRSPDESETWMSFHATSTSTGACDDTRYTMVQPLTANADGTPNFGVVQGSSYEWPEPSG